MNDIVFDEFDPDSDDSSVNLGNTSDPDVLKVYKTGEVTVVGFGGRDVSSDVCLAFYRDQLTNMIQEHKCKVLGFDMTGVTFIPSGMLGVLTSLRKKVDRVEIYNPSADVREVLHLARLEQLFEIKEASFD